MNLSIVSNTASDNYTSRKTPPWSSDVQEPKHNPDDASMAMDVDGEGDRSFHSRPGDYSGISHAGDDNLDEPLNVVTQPNGVVIIEKLDTPAIRREKNIRKKAEKKRQAALAAEEGIAAISASSSIMSVKKSSPPLPTPPQIPTASHVSPPQLLPSSASQDRSNMMDLHDIAFDEESELSELSSSSVTYSPPASPVKPSSAPPPPARASSSVVKSKKHTKPKGKRLKRQEPFPEGTIGAFLILRFPFYMDIELHSPMAVWAKSGMSYLLAIQAVVIDLTFKYF